MRDAHPLTRGTWVRSLIPVMDEGDYGERHAPEGAIGVISKVDAEKDVEGGFNYHIVFHPSGVWNVFSVAEIEQDCEVLPADSADIPSIEERRLVDATLEVFYSGSVDEGGGTVLIDLELADRLTECGKGASEEVEAAIRDMLTPDGAPIPFSKVDALAELVGVGDRFQRETHAPAP